MMKFLIHQCFLYTCLLLLLSGCGGCNLQTKDPRQEQIEHQLVVTPLQSYRLDEMVFNNADKKDFKKQIEQLPEVVSTAYLEQIMGMGKASDSSTWQTLQRFAQFKDMRDLQQASIETHGPEKIKDYEKQLAESFARLKVLLPKEENPNLKTRIKNLNHSQKKTSSIQSLRKNKKIYFKILFYPFYSLYSYNHK